MSKKYFRNYLDHLIQYQTQVVPDKNLSTDYIILYDYLIDLLEKDDVVGQFIVRKKQQTSSINADVLLDLTKLFDVRSYIHDPFLCLTLSGRENKQFEENLHPFCNEKLSIIPRNIKKYIWLALDRGIDKNGAFLRGCYGDIYELTLFVNNPYDNCIRLNAFCENINFNVNLRILVKYFKNPDNEPTMCKPSPKHEFNNEWLAKLARQSNMPFEICLPKLEKEMHQTVPKFVMIMRLLRALFKNNGKLCILDSGFLESIIYNEFMEINVTNNWPKCSELILKSVLMQILKALKTRKCPCFWNERLNLIKSFEDEILLSRVHNEFKKLCETFKNLRSKTSLKYEEFFDFFGKLSPFCYCQEGYFIDFKMEPCSYDIDQFGIFRTY